jgi:hypothetical protein
VAPATARIELEGGTSASELALTLRDAIAGNLERPAGREAAGKLRGRVLVRAEDTDRAVTIDFDAERIRIADGEEPGARIRILGDEDAILRLTLVPFRGPLPAVWSAAGRHALKRQLGVELTIRGLVLRSGSVLRVLRLLAA